MLTKNIKHKVLLLSLVLALLITAGTTIAFLIKETQPVANKFEPTKVDCLVDEDFNQDKTVKSNVQVTCPDTICNVPAFVRAKVVVSWKNSAGDVYSVSPVTGFTGNDAVKNDYTISYGTENWVKGNDGFYYYTKALIPGDEEKDNTTNLINTCAVNGDKAPEGYSLSVEIIADAIQADGESLGSTTGGENWSGKTPAEIAWSNENVTVTVNGDTLSITNK